MNSLMDKKWRYFIFSTLVMLPGLIVLVLYGLKLSIDFTGGTLLEYKFVTQVDQNQITETLKRENVDISSITRSGDTNYVIKLKPVDEKKINEIKNSLEKKLGKVETQRLENVGPIIGAETTKSALVALILASIMIVVYLAISFRKVPRPASSWKFGITAVAALLHDVVVVLGIFAILGKIYGVEIDVLFVTALLTVIGFSVHDTIVVFDRIRENLPKYLSKSFTDVANISIAQTLARSVNTSLTVIFVLLALLFFGGESIKWFVVALLIGVISGTYSSIFNATALLTLWEEKLGH